MSTSSKTRKGATCNSKYYMRYIDKPVEQHSTSNNVLKFIEAANKLENSINLLLNYYKKIN